MTASSTATARQIYDELSDRDRRVVDAWRGLGNDLTTSLLNSRVMTGGPYRVPADVPGEHHRRMFSNAPDIRWRTVLEHEAAHAVVVRNLPGVELYDVEARRDGDGETRFRGGTDRQKAAVYAAADVWVHHMRAHVLPAGDYGCRDDRGKVIRLCRGSARELSEARYLAYRVLADNHDEVIAFAEVLDGAGGRLFFGATGPAVA